MQLIAISNVVHVAQHTGKVVMPSAQAKAIGFLKELLNNKGACPGTPPPLFVDRNLDTPLLACLSRLGCCSRFVSRMLSGLCQCLSQSCLPSFSWRFAEAAEKAQTLPEGDTRGGTGEHV